MSNIDRNKLFDDGNFFYKDENDNIKQFIESAAFNINSMETYRKLSNHIDSLLSKTRVLHMVQVLF